MSCAALPESQRDRYRAATAHAGQVLARALADLEAAARDGDPDALARYELATASAKAKAA